MLRSFHLALIALVATLVGCPDAPPSTESDAAPTADVDTEADGAPSDVADGADTSADTSADTPVETVQDAGPAPVPVVDAGEAVEGGLLVWPEALEGSFVYGLGTPPSSNLTRWGSSAAGLFSMPAVVEVGDGLLTIRALDRETLLPVTGPAGAIEIYRVTTEPDGRYKIDLTEPIKSVDVVIFGDCRFTLQTYTLGSDVAFADSLMTWSAVETYRRQDCPWGGNSETTDTHVHFLRRADANPDYVARQVAAESPFGFFVAQTPTEALITRMPHVAPGAEDGTITYYTSPNVPAEYEAAIEASFDAWNDATEAAIGQRPFALEPATADMLAWNPRHRMVLWDAASQGSGGAVAPFIEDPFTGEMFETYIVLWMAELDPLIDSYQQFLTRNPTIDLGAAVPPGQLPRADASPQRQRPDHTLPPNALQPRTYPMRPLGMAEISAYMQAALAADLSDEEVAQIVVTDFVVHEIGHNLGLRHNFIASADREHTPAETSASSTMDYVVGMIAPGPYDVDAIRHGYGSGAQVDTYLFCSDEDVLEVAGCLRWDFGSPALWTSEQMSAAAADIAVTAEWQQVEDATQQENWTTHFHTLRLFVNTPWEDWDELAPFDTFQYIYDQIACPDVCATHDWFRAQWSKRLLATQLSYAAGWGPNAPVVTIDYPLLDDAQVASLYDLLMELLLDPNMSIEFKTDVVEFIPESGFAAATTLVDALLAELAALPSPSADEETLEEFLNTAKATLDAAGN